MLTKRCPKCGRVLDTSEFRRNKLRKDGLQSWCKECQDPIIAAWNKENPEKRRIASRAWQQRHPDKNRAGSRRWRETNRERMHENNRRARLRVNGLTPEQYNAIVQQQGGLCALCKGQPNGKGKRLHIDHDHSTGQQRGLLCHSCNVALGHFKDSEDILAAAIEYVRAWNIVSNGLMVEDVVNTL